MFHWVTGIPFEDALHGGAYDELTMWEQIDDGAQYTPAKKWLFSVPVLLSALFRVLHRYLLTRFLGSSLRHITPTTIPGYLR